MHLQKKLRNLECPWKKFSFTAGGFFNRINSSLRYGLSGLGVEVDMEEVLGLDTNMFVFKTEAAWRFSDNLRHRLDAGWFAINRKSSKALKEDFYIRRHCLPCRDKS